MKESSNYWLKKLSTLKIDRSRGDPAPHKPFLLLVVLEMAEKGEIKEQELSLSADLAYRFSLFNSVIADRKRPKLELYMPFHHLKTSGIWEPLTSEGNPSPHRSLTTKVRINPGFMACLRDPEFREEAKRMLIETPPYFRKKEQIALHAMLGLDERRPGRVSAKSAEYMVQAEKGRDARFRIEVVLVAYQHTCALSGYRMTTVGMESIVDAAHIHEFCDSQNNDPRNGLALSKNAHWQFDRGLWSINDNYQVMVNRESFVEQGVPGQRLEDFEGQRLFLPGDPKYWPDQQYLAWHRKNKFGK